VDKSNYTALRFEKDNTLNVQETPEQIIAEALG